MNSYCKNSTGSMILEILKTSGVTSTVIAIFKALESTRFMTGPVVPNLISNTFEPVIHPYIQTMHVYPKDSYNSNFIWPVTPLQTLLKFGGNKIQSCRTW